ncbi:MAG TPA: hypothetical protein VK766_06565 [Cytophagaceae bacterium]|jgi:hypothetical protein|nr:hypothetical protein [Cytophagaceae bacterium]
MFKQSKGNYTQRTTLYFIYAFLITAWFIKDSPIYSSENQKIFSGVIVFTQFCVQWMAALLFLKGERQLFLRNISRTYLIGSMMLLPYCFSAFFKGNTGFEFFFVSLLLYTGVMIFSYYRSVKKSFIGIHWWSGWLFSTTIAIIIQLKIVFNVSLI